jgi:hypothetical protein
MVGICEPGANGLRAMRVAVAKSGKATGRGSKELIRDIGLTLQLH